MFSFDEILFAEALKKVREVESRFLKKNSDIYIAKSISDTYDGKEQTLNSCTNLENIMATLKTLESDMSSTDSIMKGTNLDNNININNIFSNLILNGNLSSETIEFLNIIASLKTEDDFFNLLRGFIRTQEESFTIANTIEDILYADNPSSEDYEKIALILIYYQEKSNFDELKSKYSYVKNRIIELEKMLGKDNFQSINLNQKLQEYKHFLLINKDNPELIANHKITIDDQTFFFATYEEGMDFINNYKESKAAEIASLNQEKQELAKEIEEFMPNVSLQIDANNNIMFVPSNNQTFQELIENIDLVKNGVYSRVLGKKSNENQLMNFFDNNLNPVGGIGCDQSVFKKMTFDDPEYLRLKDKLINEYKFSEEDAAKCFQLIDCIGACTYGATTNVLLTDLEKDKELAAAFEKASGISLYTPEGDLNTAELLLDLFIFVNLESDTTYGEFFYQKDGKYHIFDEIEFVPPVETVGEVSDFDTGYRELMPAASSRGPSINILNLYLKSKDENLSLTSDCVIIHEDDNPEFSAYKAQKILKPLIDEGTPLMLGIDAFATGDTIRLSDYDMGLNNIYYQSKDFGRSHEVNVVGYDTDGVIINSWGSFYRIPWYNLASPAISIFKTKFSLNN